MSTMPTTARGLLNAKNTGRVTIAPAASVEHPALDPPICGSQSQSWTGQRAGFLTQFSTPAISEPQHSTIWCGWPTLETRALTDLIEAEEGGVLDDYIEAHVHGQIPVDRDVEAIALDPSFQGAPIEDQTARLGVPVEWHEGRRLLVSELHRHPHFRGPRMVEVGRRILSDGASDARTVREAHYQMREDPQDLKKVWHHVARCGEPVLAARQTTPSRLPILM